MVSPRHRLTSTLSAAALAAAVGCAHTDMRPDRIAGLTPDARASAPATGALASPSLVSSARWSGTSQGYRLQVRPSHTGRAMAATHVARALEQSFRAARPTPLRITRDVRASLSDQLRCHAVFAPRKPSWNLEAWRPDVGYADTVLHECNP